MNNHQMKAIIIDDENKAIESLQLLINEFCAGIQVIGICHSAKEARQMISELEPDLIFLDIEMPLESGFDLLQSLPEIEFQIIFTTAYNQYAIKAFKFSAIDYLLKPVKIPDLIEAIKKAHDIWKNRKSQQQQYQVLIENLIKKPVRIVVATTEGREYLLIKDIIYIEGDVNYSKIKIADGRQIIVSKTLKEYEDLLADEGFFRSHKSFLINLEHIKRISNKEGGSVIMTDSTQVLLSRRNAEELLNAMKNITKNK